MGQAHSQSLHTWRSSRAWHGVSRHSKEYLLNELINPPFPSAPSHQVFLIPCWRVHCFPLYGKSLTPISHQQSNASRTVNSLKKKKIWDLKCHSCQPSLIFSCPRTRYHRCLKGLVSNSVRYHEEKRNLFFKLHKLTCPKSMKTFLHDSILTVNKNLSIGSGIGKNLF